ncbi:type II 3-dehydroquinate dehydratase [Okibacterium fritillariae]|nr:type II 3-dehydroquinate dehydratase [Okibacterium fritillariae]
MAHRILVLNGPNLGRLGSREPDVYGSADLESLRSALAEDAERAARGSGDSAPVSIDLRQTDDEAELIHWLHEAVDTRTPVILNPAAFTHYSYGLRDAAAQLHTADIPLVEVHISNPHARERFRHTSVISGVATGVIAGFGFDSYRLALHYLLTR